MLPNLPPLPPHHQAPPSDFLRALLTIPGHGFVEGPSLAEPEALRGQGLGLGLC